MQKVLTLYQTTVGKKFTMAVTGLFLFLFIVGHMAGNLKIFFGPEKFNHYAQFLREVGSPLFGHGGFLWIFRIVLLLAVGVHVVAVVQLWLISRGARGVGYTKLDDISFSYASRTMRWGGVLIAFFVIYHLLHLTVGTVHPSFDHESPYHNVVAAFSVWWVALVYAIAVILLGLHLYHGLWSTTQTLAIRSPQVMKWRRPAAAAVATLIVLGYLSVPAAVLAGWVR